MKWAMLRIQKLPSHHFQMHELLFRLLEILIKKCRSNDLQIKSGTYRARTCDPLLVRQMLSQLS